MGIRREDWIVFAMVVGSIIVLGGAVFAVKARLGMVWRDFLTGREAVVLLKILSIFGFLALLAFGETALRLPAEMFIYGRF